MSAYADLILGTPGLVAYWRLNERQGTVARDSGANGLDAVYDAGITLDQPGIPNDIDRCVYLPDGGDDVQVGDDPLLRLDGFTAEFWVYLVDRGGASWQNFLFKGSGETNRNYLIGMRPDNNAVLGSFGLGAGEGFSSTTTTSFLQISTWHHIAYTHEQNGFERIYFDGREEYGSDAHSAKTPPVDASDLYVCAQGSGGDLKRMDEVAVYDRDLTAAEVLARYEAGMGAPVRVSFREEKWLAAELNYGDGRTARFGPDERDDADVPKSIQFDTQVPGGFGSGSLVLPRPLSLRADDAKLFSSSRIYGPGNRTAHEGRVVGVPQVGPEEIRLELEGWSAHLDDDETFREIYVDADLSHWKDPSVQQQINVINAGYGGHGATVKTDRSSGEPSLVLGWHGDWVNPQVSSAWYDGEGIPLHSVQAGWKMGPNYNGGDGNYNWVVEFYNGDNDSTGGNSSGDLQGAGVTGYVELLATVGTSRKFARLYYSYAAAGGTAGAEWNLDWTKAAVYGKHGLTKRGIASNTVWQGFYGSDVIAHAIGRSAPLLNIPAGAIEPSTFIIPHLVFLEAGTVRRVVEQVTALGGAQLVPNDWGVYDNREFFHRSPGTYGKTWRVRRDQVAAPLGEGPDSKTRTGGMMIVYRDMAGGVHSVGPPGSDADVETTDLQDSDPDNPAGRLERKWKRRDVGITSQEGATLIGQLLLLEANRSSWRGTTKVAGEAVDDAGNAYPSYRIRAGDRLVIEEDAEEGEEVARTVNSTSYDQDSLALTANVGAVPHTGEALLANLAAATGLLG